MTAFVIAQRLAELRRWRRPALRLALPLFLASALIWSEPYLTTLARYRPGVLPVAMAALLGGLLLSQVRRWLIVTLCFGIALLALRDAYRPPALPPALDYELGFYLDALRPIGWTLLAVLAGVAGAGEALRPGAVWARRCYFGAASLYLSGHGLLSFLRRPNWEALVLLATGLVALLGVVTAQRIVTAECEAQPDEEDIVALHSQNVHRSEKLAAREWQDHPEKLTKTR